MPRRRLILPTLFLLLATFVVAVQHDTFIRRWCLPTPPPATRAAGPLDQVIDEFVVDDAHPSDTIWELERRTGVRIDEARTQDFRHAWSLAISVRAEGGASVRRPCTIQRATVEQLLSRILAPFMWCYDELNDPFTTSADGTVNLRAGTTSERQTVVRVHNVDPILLQPNAQWTLFPSTTVTHQMQRVTSWGEADPVLRFGDKLIVITSPRSHWLIDQILHEEAEAQHAIRNHPAATRPAQ